MFPEISVVIPLFNKAPYIQRCAGSILRQSVDRYEVIVVDDGSTDGGGDLVASIADPRVRLITQENQGAGAARNRGIQEAKTELIAFLDADDEWDPEFLAAILSLARRFPSAGFLATGFRRQFAGNISKETTVYGGQQQLLITDYLRRVRGGDFVTCSSTAVWRTALKTTGLFAVGEPIGEDSDLWARIALQYSLAFDTRILATYHSEAEGRSFELWRGEPPYPPVVRSLGLKLSEGHPGPGGDDMRSYIDWRLMKYAYWLLDLDNRERLAGLLATECFYTRRFRLEALLLRLGLMFLPVRVIRALKWKPARVLAFLTGSDRMGVWKGGDVISRTVPAASPAICSFANSGSSLK